MGAFNMVFLFKSVSVFFSFLLFLLISLHSKVFFGILLDPFSLFLVGLSCSMFYLMIKFSSFFVSNFVNFYMYMKLLLWGFMNLFFIVGSFFFFFCFFELSMVPVFFIILCWGSQPERLRASFFFFLYALMGGLPLLVAVFSLYYYSGSFKFYLLSYIFGFTGSFESTLLGFLLLLYWVLSFIMKMPLFGFHYWLPLAHVEAPVGGSMALAGVLIKMGSYGLLRLSYLKFSYNFMSNYFFFWVLFGKVLLGIYMYRILDLKSIMAYSSMVHMSLTFLVLYTFSYISFLGFFLLLISHAFMSSGLFYYVGWMYKATGSRSFMLKGGYKFFCLSISYFFLFLLYKMSFPPFSSFLSEFFLVRMVLGFSSASFVFLIITFVLVGFFNMYMFSLVSHGKSFLIGRYGCVMRGGFYLGCFMHLLFFFFIVFLISFFF